MVRNINMSQESIQESLTDPIEQFATGQTPFPATSTETIRNGTIYIAAGNGDAVSNIDLGAVSYDRSKHSTIEPVYDESSHHQLMIGLKIHNPDNSQLGIDLREYKIPGDSQTNDLRTALLETYQREVLTDRGTEILIQNAQYFKSVSWTIKNADILNNPEKLESSLIAGELHGSFNRKPPEVQNQIFYQQHEAMQEATERALAKSAHANNHSEKKLLTLQDLLDAHLPPDTHHDVIKLLLEKQEALTQPQATQGNEPIR